MTFDEILTQVLDLLQREGRVSYRALKRRFDLDEEYLEDLKVEIIQAKRLAIDESNTVLVWTGGSATAPAPTHDARQTPASYTPSHLAERILAEQAAMEARGALDGERKTITILFADIKGSMALIEGLDPEEARDIVDPTLKIMMDAVHRYEGYVAQSTGDGIFAFFGAPIAHEDHAQRALYAALLMQEACQRYAERLRRERGLNLQIRVGLNTGEVVVRAIRKDDLHTDYTPVGHSTSLAARMESLATPGTIVVSEHTYKLTAGYFEFKALGPAQVKGVSEPVHIYEVVGVGPLRTRLQVAAHRGLVRFVGRQRELEQMRQALEFTREGHGQIVAVMGEPGVGKSRLCYEFKQHSQPGFLVLETFSVSHGKAYAYLPLIELLKQYFQITPQDDERQRREKITGRLLTLDRSLEDLLPYVFFLLGIAEPTSPLQQMDPQIRRRRMFEVIKRLLLRESLNHPLLLVFEDLHWLDAETQAFLAFLSDSIATARILLLVNYRPEYQHSWGSKTYYTQLRLDPLGQQEAHELLTALLGDNPALQPLKQRILADTEGNPFFIEEIVQTLVEQGILVRDAGAGLKLVPTTTPLTAMRLPSTVQGVLASRIDRLPATEKSLLQTLAVIGKKFSLSLLTQVVNQPDEELYPLLSHLQAAEFIYEQPAFPELEYTFKHALTQEVAYNSLLLEPRRILHERAAQAIEAHYCDRLEDYYNELAHHYSRSGNTQKAVVYLQRAGEQALQRSAHGEALAHLTVALELLAPLPNTPDRIQQELQLRVILGEALVVTKGYTAPDVEQTYTRALELCQQVGDPSRRFRVLFGLWRFHFVRGEFWAAHDLASQLMHLAQQVDDLLPHMVAHLTQGFSLCALGEWSAALTHLERSITCYDALKHGPDQSGVLAYSQDPKVTCLSYAALALWSLGHPDQALKRVYQALTLAQESSRPFSLAFAMYFAAFVHRLRGEAQVVQERADAVIALADAHGFPFWVALGTMLRGWALAEQGQATAGIEQIRQALASYRAMGAEVEQSAILLIEACANAGLIDEGLSLLAEALAKAHNVGYLLGEVELHRLRGELLLRQAVGAGGSGSTTNPSRHNGEEAGGAGLKPALTDEAETCFRYALDTARRQGGKSLELRAAMSLSRLWQQHSRREEARQLLEPIYGWFTEGFDTADLKEAKALLDQLSRTTLGEGDKMAE